MSRVVRISDESYRRLKAWAEPLDDNADDAFRKVLDAADLQRAVRQPVTLSANLVGSSPGNPPGIQIASVEEIQPEPVSGRVATTVAEKLEPMYVSLPDEFKSLSKSKRKQRGILARKAYVDRIGVPSSKPEQWVRTKDGMYHYLGYSSMDAAGLQSSSDRWFFGAEEKRVEKYLHDSTLGSFVFLCGVSDSMIIAVPVGIKQLEQMVRLGLFAENKGQLKFHVRREAGDKFYLEDRPIE